MAEADVRAAFAAQAGHCEALGSAFTARLCRVAGEELDRSTAIGRRVLDWPGDPDARADSVPLRLAGGLHALVRRGRLPALAALYPPHPLPEPAALRAAFAAALAEAGPDLDPWLDGPPQTNEVARSGVLMAGLLAVAAAWEKPFHLSELGASAGLNLVLDRYAYDLGGRRAGAAGASLRLTPAWEGGPPPAAQVRVLGRRGVDRAPLDVAEAADRERLLAYVWPDQAERLARIEAALALARSDPPPIDRADAAEWLPRRLAAVEGPHVVTHSIALQYFSDAGRGRVAAALAEAGGRATREAPLAWLRYEMEAPADAGPSLRLVLWPGGQETLLARADAHGRRVRWLA
jgi:hypothetical protein